MSVLTQERIKELFAYDDISGTLVNLVSRGRTRKGKVADCLDMVSGYYKVMIDRKLYCQHRVIWLLVNGELPECLDHINGNRIDNRLENLRAATKSENMHNRANNINSSTGIKGLHLSKSPKQSDRYLAKIRLNNKSYHKSFHLDQKDDAIAWLKTTRVQLHGEFTNHG